MTTPVSEEIDPTAITVGTVRRFVRNSASLVASDVFSKATTFVLYTLVARELGAFAFGQISLALTLLYTFQIFAVAGLKTLITREVARDRSTTGAYFVNASAVVLVASIVSYGGLFALTQVLNYEPRTAEVVLLLGLALLPYSLSMVCEGIFQGWERMHFVTAAQVPANLVKVTIAVVLLTSGSALTPVVLLLVASYSAVLVIEWSFVAIFFVRPRLVLDPPFALRMLRATSPFLAIDGLIALKSSVLVILLSSMSGEREVGLYSAVLQLMVPVALLYTNLVQSVFPAMSRRFQSDVGALKDICERLIELLVAIGLPAIVTLTFLAPAALVLLYGDQQFATASTVLRIVVWTLLLAALTNALGQVLWASRREKTSLKIVLMNLVGRLVLGLALIKELGLLGAAIATLLAEVINVLMHYVPVARLLSGISIARLSWKPLVAGCAMTLALVLMSSYEGPWLSVTVGVIVYVAVLAGLYLWTLGGPAAVGMRYAAFRNPSSERETP